ncbi:MAG: lamin tail domain-containing protein [Ilumatobacter sp.]|uniref:lamin tail domain-containing protein n=1 Tax=Ilumatobacter sp. TaxID=1967498 RepID=UPI003299A941
MHATLPHRRAAVVTALCLSASAAGVLTTAPAASAAVTPSAIDLAGYSIVGRYPLPTQFDSEAPAGSELATEVSAITYDWDSDTLFVVGDEGTSVVQVSTTGELIDSMSLVGFEDTEGLSYVGGGQFVVAEERLRNAVLVTYAGGTVLDRADATAVKLGTTIGNIGLEGIGYDPLTTGPDGLGFIGVKESAPLGVFQTNIDFDAGTATNGGPGVENPVDLFDPTLVGTTDLSDVFPLSLLPDLDGGDSENLLIISQESGRIVNVDRNGVIDSQVDITDVGAPLTVPAQTMEGVTLDRDNVMYTTSEGGGGSATRPQLLVWATDASPLTRLAVTEVAPWGGDASYGADWFELTNTGSVPLDLTDVSVDDGSNDPTLAAPLLGVSSLAPGESAIFLETTDLPTVSANFATAWFGDAGLPDGLQLGSYFGSGLGLSGNGDAVNVFAPDDTHVTGVSFAAATTDITFDNVARHGAAAAPVAIDTLASEGVNLAFVAADGIAVGSPGNLVVDPGGPSGDTSGIRITEVAAFGSGNSPYAVDWFEVTNTGSTSVNLSGWVMDDSSATFASGAELIGVPVLPAGASAIFFEGTDDAAFELAFAQAWFQQNLFDDGFFFGHYTGGGVGLSTGGDAVTVFDASGALVTGVAFGASPLASPFATFDNAEGLGSNTTPLPTLTTLSEVGVNGAFAAAQAQEIGSPGTAGVPQAPLADVAVTEVAPWASGDAPYGADWFEITNTGTDTVDLTGFAVDDSSNSFAEARTLIGVGALGAGESAVFVEASPEEVAATTEQFLTAWVGSVPLDATPIGTYSGSGIGLSTSGDEVNLFDPAGRKVAGVSFAASTSGFTYDNTAALSGPISTLSLDGVDGAFTAADGHGVGSPGGLSLPDPVDPVDPTDPVEPTDPVDPIDPGTPMTFQAVTPTRFVDTRANGVTIDGTFAQGGKRSAGSEYRVQMSGRGDVPDDAAAVVVNVAAVAADGVGFVTIHPCVTPRPVASSLNFTAGVNIGNETVTLLTGSGEVCLFTREAVHLVVDVTGFVPDGSSVVPVIPSRFLDTRANGVTVDGASAGGSKPVAGAVVRLPVAGRGPVPPEAAAAVVNVTAVAPEGTGFVTAYPCTSEVPVASSLNFVAGVNRANELIAPLDDAGGLCLFVSAGVHLVADVVGFLPAGSDLTPIGPARLLDTRSGGATVDGGSSGDGRQGPNGEYRLQVTGRGGVPLTATSAVVNVTAVGADGTGFVTVHPCVTPRPFSSTINYVAGVNGANEVLTRLSADGAVCIHTSARIHLVVDVVATIS